LNRTKELIEQMNNIPTIKDVLQLQRQRQSKIKIDDNTKNLDFIGKEKQEKIEHFFYNNIKEDYFGYSNKENNESGKNSPSNKLRHILNDYLNIMDNLQKASWKTYLLPVVSKNTEIDNQQENLVQEKINTAYVLASLPSSIPTSGKVAIHGLLHHSQEPALLRDLLEDSLQWVSFCLAQVTVEDLPSQYQELRQQLIEQLLSFQYKHQHDPSLPQKSKFNYISPRSLSYKPAHDRVQQIQEKIHNNAAMLQQHVVAKIMRQIFQKMGKKYQEYSQVELNQAIIKLQAIVRGYLARKLWKQKRYERRIQHALKYLVSEISEFHQFQGNPSYSGESHTIFDQLFPLFQLPPPHQTKRKTTVRTTGASTSIPRTSLEGTPANSTHSALKKYSVTWTPTRTPYSPAILTRPVLLTTRFTTSTSNSSSSSSGVSSNSVDNNKYQSEQFYSDSKISTTSDGNPSVRVPDLHFPWINKSYQNSPAQMYGVPSDKHRIRRTNDDKLIIESKINDELGEKIGPKSTGKSLKSVQFSNNILSTHSTPINNNITHISDHSVLSPFLGLHPGDVSGDGIHDNGFGYVSTPSISRSLTESFGKVELEHQEFK
jgi:hypothetical protein